VLIFRADWCPPCGPLLDELSSGGGSWPDSGAVICAVDAEGSPGDASAQWPGVRRAVLLDGRLLVDLRIEVLPTTLVLTRSGTVAARFEGYCPGLGAEVRKKAAEAWAE